MIAAQPPADESSPELRPLLHEEVNRLPEKYRAPVVLCYLQGKTNEEAGRQLAWPIGTVKGRLTRARQLLRKRLTRRGLALPAAAFAAVLAQGTASAAMPAVLVDSTVKAALQVAAGQAALAGVVPAQVAALTRGVLQAMFLTRATIAGTVFLTMSVLGTGAGLLTYHTLAAEPGVQERAARPAQAARAAAEPRKEGDKDSEPADRERSHENLKQIALAMLNWESAYRRYPAAAIYDKDGKALLSWRVLLLPYLDQNALFKEFKLDEPWDSEHNKKLLARMPKIYAPPRGEHKEHATVYQVFTGRGTLFEGTQGRRIAEITDGTANTIGVVEAAEAVPWTKPADLPYDPVKPLPKLGGMFKDIFHAAFADGRVHVLKMKFDEQTMRAVITCNGGEIYEPDKIEADK